MTSFGEQHHHQPILASSRAEEYPLYPFSIESYSDIYDPQSQSQSMHFALGNYSTHHNYPQNTHSDFVLDAYENHHQKHLAKTPYFPHSPTPSPTYSSAINPFDLQPPVLSSTSDSGASVQSNASSALGSPSMSTYRHHEWIHLQDPLPAIVPQDSFGNMTPSAFDYETMMTSKHPGCVDPSLIRPNSPPNYNAPCFVEMPTVHPQQGFLVAQQPPSPSPSATSAHSNSRLSLGPVRNSRATSPFKFSPYPKQQAVRRPSVSSSHSRQSRGSRDSQSSHDSAEDRNICPIPSCGRHMKDLKAHLLTHKNERPEKCPISSCEYHLKGFARKYDKNRHTLTHYKGTMVCGFCPGSGSSSEKSFNRADVFKRHLTSVHGVEQTAPNSKRKGVGANSTQRNFGIRETSGTCSTCGGVFANAQDLYEHLDDCVLRVVQQGDPAEAINERLLTSVAQDDSVQSTLKRHMLSSTLDFSASMDFAQDEDEEEEGVDGNSGVAKKRHSNGQEETPFITLAKSMHGARSGQHVQGMTHSRGGMPLHNANKGNKRRKDYPPTWGAAPEKMRKKRVLTVFDGSRRLWKDDMMLDVDNEVRIPLPGGDGRSYVTNLDVQTLRRAEGLHGATEEERGSWMNEDGVLVNYE